MNEHNAEPRDAFEAWAQDNIGQFSSAGYYGTNGAWVYRHHFQNLVWLAWCAATEAAPVKPEAVPAATDPLYHKKGWECEAADLDALLHLFGLNPRECRTEGGNLKLAMVRERIAALPGDTAEAPVQAPACASRQEQQSGDGYEVLTVSAGTPKPPPWVSGSEEA